MPREKNDAKAIRLTSVRRGYTLAELLIALAIASVLTTIVITAVAPRKQIGAAQDVARQNVMREMETAMLDYIISNPQFLKNEDISETPKPICKEGITDVSCVNIANLVPTYLRSFPKDSAEPQESPYSGFEIALVNGRTRISSAHYGEESGVLLGQESGGGFNTQVYRIVGQVKDSDAVETASAEALALGEYIATLWGNARTFAGEYLSFAASYAQLSAEKIGEGLSAIGAFLQKGYYDIIQ